MHAEKPIFIVAAPRSGSTLLYETLVNHQQLWSFRDEGHGWIEKYPQLRPLRGGVASNRLTETDLDDNLAEQLRQDMLQGLISAQGNHGNAETGAIRLLEKTPKNCLRIPFIDSIYPDARYIYLYRDPKDSIASIMEGWRHQRFVTYADVKTALGYWCFLRPPGWQEMVQAPLPEIAAFQWRICQEVIIDDLAGINAERWTTCAFDEFLSSPQKAIGRLQTFCELDSDPTLEAYCAAPLPYSRYTQTAPAAGKWQQHGTAIANVFPSLIPTIERINRTINETQSQLETAMPSPGETAAAPPSSGIVGTQRPGNKKPGRNDRCPCGSGRKYKHCHGQLA